MQCPTCKKQFFGIGVCPECGGPLYTQEQMYKYAWADKHRRTARGRIAPEIRDSLIRLTFVFVFSCLILLAVIFIANSIAEKKLSIVQNRKMIKSEKSWQHMSPTERRDKIKERFKTVVKRIDDEFNQQ